MTTEERARIEQEQRVTEARTRVEEYQRKVDREAHSAMVRAGLLPGEAWELLRAIRNGVIPHVTLNY